MSQGGGEPDAVAGEQKLPLFPLGSTAYLPHSSHVLNIFEPRYREMYNDILMNGSRRFVVAMVHPADGRVAETGAVFYLSDLKEVSEQTGDQIKYVCKHEVVGRVNISRVLNPEAWRDRSTYLRVACEPLEDADVEAETSGLERDVVEALGAVVRLQSELGEALHFTDEVMKTASAARGEGGLWGIVALLQEFAQQKLIQSQSEVEQSIQGLLQEFVKNRGVDPGSGGQIKLNFQDLPEELQAELARLQSSYDEDVRPAMLEFSLKYQGVLACGTHEGRLRMVKDVLEEEKKVLEAKASLKALFAEGD